MFDEPIDRAQWLATYIMPIEPESRGWLRRVAPAGLEVDDVIQEAYKILAGLADVSHIANPRAYFYQVIKSVIAEHLRRASVARGAVANPQVLPEQEGLTPERIVSGREDLAGLYRAITRLPEPCRTIFIFRKIDNLPQKEIAAKLRVSENTVEKQIARGLRIILTQLKADSDSDHAAPRVPSTQRGEG